VQDALWTVVRKIDRFTGGSAFNSWLYRVVTNVADDTPRGRRGRFDDCSLDEVSAMDEYRTLVVLRELEGRSYGSLVTRPRSATSQRSHARAGAATSAGRNGTLGPR